MCGHLLDTLDPKRRGQPNNKIQRREHMMSSEPRLQPASDLERWAASSLSRDDTVLYIKDAGSQEIARFLKTVK
jgi:hypothetical protein